MANCDSLSGGISLGCSSNFGGVKKIYLTNKENVSSVVNGSPDLGITTFNMVGGAVFYEFEFNKNTSSWSEARTGDQANGVEFYTQTLTLVLNRREKTKRDTIALLGGFRELVAVVTDSNDNSWYLGAENGLVLTGNEGGSGTAKTDPNRYTLTLTGEEPEMADVVLAAAIAAVI
jgi:hypothetical protein